MARAVHGDVLRRVALVLCLAWSATRGNAQLFPDRADIPTDPGPVALAGADFDDDGDIDLAVGHFDTNTVSILINDGSGGAAEMSYDLRPGDPVRKTLSVAAVDVDQDGDEDVAALLHDLGTLAILRNDGAGNLTVDALSYLVNDAHQPTHTEFVTAGQMDDDGIVDLLVASPSRGEAVGGTVPGHVSVLLNQGDGSGAFTLDGNYPSDDRLPNGIAVADLDGDGDQDLAVVNWGSNDLAIFLNDGAGGLALDDTYLVGVSPSRVVAADLDGDGDQDLAATGLGSDTLAVLYRDDDPAFPGRLFPHGITYMNGPGIVFQSPFGVAAADFDCNGALDLAVVNSVGDDVVVFLNRNLGPDVPNLFAFDDSYAVGDNPVEVVAADLDADGAPDLAVANSDSHTVTIRLNTGCPPRLAHVCRAAKLAAAGRKASGLLSCHAKAAKKGEEAADVQCLGKAGDKFAKVFAKAEARGGCTTSGDASSLEGLIDATSNDVADDLAPGASDPTAGRCASAKLKASAKKAAGRLACHSRAAKKQRAVEPGCLAKVHAKLLDAFVQAEARGGCATSADSTAVAAKIDALAVSLVDALGR